MSLINEPYENADFVDGMKAALQDDRTASGFTAPSNVASTLTFDAVNTTPQELAHVLGTLITHLLTEKII